MSGKAQQKAAPKKAGQQTAGKPAKGQAAAKKSGASGNPSAQQSGQPLQALLLADSFDEFFRPLTLEIPRCLLPVVNVPMINYTIESLAGNGVEEIFIFCCSHAEKIEAHIRQLISSGRLPDVSLKCVVSKNSTSVGDALREVHQMGILHDDFVLVYGDVISNMKLSRVVQEHVQRRQKDKQAIMTLLLAPCRSMRTPALATPTPPPSVNKLEDSSSHAAAQPGKQDVSEAATKAKAAPKAADAFEDDYDDDYDDADADSSDDMGEGGSSDEEDVDSTSSKRGGDGTFRRLVALDADSSQLLVYVDSSGVTDSKQQGDVEMDMTLFEHRNRLVFRHDLEEAGIAVCSADVLFQFQDNFDYQHVPQFVRGVVNEEILSCRVFAFVEPSVTSYSSRVSSLRRYQHVSWDILQRWAFPYTPDTNLVATGTSESNYSFVRDVRGGPGVYLQRPVHLARSAIVSGAAAFAHTEVLKATQHERLPAVASAVGEQTQIGAGSVVVASCIGRNCRIGQNVVIVCSHLWDNVQIGDNCIIVGGLLASNTSLGPSCIIRQGALLSYGVHLPGSTVVPPLAKLCCKTSAATKPFLGSDSIRQMTAAPIPFNELVLGWEPQLQAKAATPQMQPKNSSRPRAGSSSSSAFDDNSEEDSYDDFAFDKTGAGSNAKPEPSGKKKAQAAADSFEESDEDDGANEVSDIERFRMEVASTVVRAVTANHKMETLVLEINSLKYAYDASFLESAGSIFEGLMNTLDQQPLTAKTLTARLTKWGPIFSKFLMDTEEQTEFIFKIQEFCERDDNDKYAKFFQNVLHVLYDVDVLDEEAIFSWADEQKQSGEDLKLYNQCQKLLEWLKNAASESDDE